LEHSGKHLRQDHERDLVKLTLFTARNSRIHCRFTGAISWYHIIDSARWFTHLLSTESARLLMDDGLTMTMKTPSRWWWSRISWPHEKKEKETSREGKARCHPRWGDDSEFEEETLYVVDHSWRNRGNW